MNQTNNNNNINVFLGVNTLSKTEIIRVPICYAKSNDDFIQHHDFLSNVNGSQV
jgi:hypothetical protein